MIKLRKSRLGVSLLEIMLVLAIIAIILVMATRYFALARSEEQISEGVKMIGAIRSAGERWLLSHDDYSNISVTALQNFNLLPTTFGPNNPWGGAIAVEKGSAGNIIKITFKDIPVIACNSLGIRLAGDLINPPCIMTIGKKTTDFVGNFR